MHPMNDISSTNTSMTKWKIIVVVQLLIIFALSFILLRPVFLKSTQQKQDYKIPKVTVETDTVKKTSFKTFISSVGTLKASDSVKISSQEGGYIKQVPFKSGANVSKGDLLLQIDDDEEQAQLKEIEARLVVAQKAYERFKALKQKQYVSEADFEKKEGEYLSLLAQRERIKVRITHKKIVAPFSGIVGFKELSPGAFVKSGQELVQLDSVKPIYVDFKVNEKHINLLNEGSSVEVEVEGFPDNVYNAEVVAIEPMADEIGHSVRVRASIENVMDELRSGFYAKVKFMEGLKKTFEWYLNNKKYYKTFNKKDIENRLGKVN